MNQMNGKQFKALEKICHGYDYQHQMAILNGTLYVTNGYVIARVISRDFMGIEQDTVINYDHIAKACTVSSDVRFSETDVIIHNAPSAKSYERTEHFGTLRIEPLKSMPSFFTAENLAPGSIVNGFYIPEYIKLAMQVFKAYELIPSFAFNKHGMLYMRAYGQNESIEILVNNVTKNKRK